MFNRNIIPYFNGTNIITVNMPECLKDINIALNRKKRKYGNVTWEYTNTRLIRLTH